MAGGGGTLVPVHLDVDGVGEADVRALLQSVADAAVPASCGGNKASLMRTVLRCLLGKGLKQRTDGSFEMQPVVTAPLGEAVVAAVAADGEQRALYQTAGHKLEDLLSALQTAGVITVTQLGVTKYAAANQRWLQRQLACVQQQPALFTGSSIAGGSSTAGNGKSSLPPISVNLADYPRIMGNDIKASPGHTAFMFNLAIQKVVSGKTAPSGGVVHLRLDEVILA